LARVPRLREERDERYTLKRTLAAGSRARELVRACACACAAL
jgi:hypothetical protein